MHIKTVSVSQLNSYIKKIIDNDFILKNSYVKGEISNLKLHNSGHIYFSLKDEYSKINCIMFKPYVESMIVVPQDGDNVILKGRVSVYQKDGVYQFYCEELEKEGIGNLYLAFEKLKNKLHKEGLFDEKHKKDIPKYARRIGVITSSTGAAIRDIINVTKRRNPTVELVIYPSLVQGNKASYELVKGIKYFDSRGDVDLIILARGGGSLEELWAFNEENLAYAIYNCNKPIISGVGHETDFTICDFVSDRRASTPSAAAEIAVFNLNELNEKIEIYKSKVFNAMKNSINSKYDNLNILMNNLKINSPMGYIANEYIRVDSIKNELLYRIESKIQYEKGNLVKLNSLLQAHNPLNILNRGFSVIQDEKGSIITEVNQLSNSKYINITLKKDKAKVYLSSVEKTE
ncbi:exodeoxyribonuclease VII large subunit [Clostridium bovifaecis]|uniref:Exodeoxyribonuclease 7 large subunit n=1 Tax=Clostridium bovifaecis TaxID=2184719 RepID=A0A6I6F1L2_9CLOT|nr:exodeoxyribonuclease VII large subunit [Clostridium bovifaecis]